MTLQNRQWLTRCSSPLLALGLALLSTVTWLSGCGDSGTDRCAGVTCPEGKSCLPANGQCISTNLLDMRSANKSDLAGTDGATTRLDSGGAIDMATGDTDASMAMRDMAIAPGQDMTVVPDMTIVPDMTVVPGHDMTQNVTQDMSMMATDMTVVVASDMTMVPLVDLSSDAGAAPSNSCMPPLDLNLLNNKATATGNTSLSTSATSSAGCGGLGPDYVYQVTIPRSGVLSAVVTPDANLQPVVYIRDACASTSAQHEVGCFVTNNAGDTASLTTGVLAAGTYFVWVDSYSGSMGAYTLDVTFTPFIVPDNDTCAAPAQLTFTNNVATAAVDTTFANDDIVSPACGGTGPDEVYVFTINATQSVVAVVTPSMGSPSFDPVVSIRSACGSDVSEIGCNSANAGGMPARVAIKTLPKGTYYVWVDGYSDSLGTGTLTVTLAPPLPDTCATAETLMFMGNVATAMPDTTDANDDSSASCGGLGNDVVYKITTMADQKITATVTPDPGSPNYVPVVYIRPESNPPGTGCDMADDLACRYHGIAAKPVTASIIDAPAGVYYVWVDSKSGTSGLSTLTVTLDPPMTPCSTATTIVEGATLMGDTADSNDNFGAALSATCLNASRGMGAPGHDLVYSFTPTTSGQVTITLTPTSNWDCALWVMPAMCAADGSLCTDFADAFFAPGAETLKINVTAMTPYYIVVDSAVPMTDFGSFTLTVQ